MSMTGTKQTVAAPRRESRRMPAIWRALPLAPLLLAAAWTGPARGANDDVSGFGVLQAELARLGVDVTRMPAPLHSAGHHKAAIGQRRNGNDASISQQGC